MAKRIAAKREMGSIQTLIDRFGPEHYDAKRNVYRVPGKFKGAFDEMAAPHRRLETQRGMEIAAEGPPKVRLRHRDGRIGECTEGNAQAVAKLTGAVEAPRYRGQRIIPLGEVWAGYSGFAEGVGGYLFRVDSGLVTPTGHRHLPFMEPQPWIKAYCKGCQEEEAGASATLGS